MGDERLQRDEIWRLVHGQHGLITRRQLISRGLSDKAIRHRIAVGRLHPVYRGVYAVGRPGLTQEGRWMAAVLVCGRDALLSHLTAAQLWRLRAADREPLHVSVPMHLAKRIPSVAVHRRAGLFPARRSGIPVTDAVSALLDAATLVPRPQLEAMINQGDKLGSSRRMA